MIKSNDSPICPYCSKKQPKIGPGWDEASKLCNGLYECHFCMKEFRVEVKPIFISTKAKQWHPKQKRL